MRLSSIYGLRGDDAKQLATADLQNEMVKRLIC